MKDLKPIYCLLGLIIFMVNQVSASDLQDLKIQFQGQNRRVRVFVPSNKKNVKMPALLVLHGGMGSIEKIRKQFGKKLEMHANKNGFFVVYPQSTKGKESGKNHWNDGRGANYGGSQVFDIDDVGFLNHLATELGRRYQNLNKESLFLGGVSNGGTMTLRVACQSPHMFAGFFNIIGSLAIPIQNSCKSPLNKPVLFISGTEDRLVSFDGKDRRPRRLKKKDAGKALPVKESIRFFATLNQCQKTSPQMKNLLDKNKDDGSTVVQVDYRCSKQSRTRMFKIRGGGHSIPGGEVKNFLIRRLVGTPNKDTEASQLLVDFFNL